MSRPARRKGEEAPGWTLRQAPSVSCPATSSTGYLPTKKKKPVAQPTQKTPVLSSPSPSSLASSLASTSFAASTELDSPTDSSSIGTEQEIRVKPVVSHIICEEKGDKDMTTNLRVGFKERQRKCLSKSIMVAPLPAKKPCTKVLCSVPVSTIHLALKPSVIATGPSHVLTVRLSVGKDACLELGGPSIGPAQLSNDSVEWVASVSPRLQVPRAPNHEKNG